MSALLGVTLVVVVVVFVALPRDLRKVPARDAAIAQARTRTLSQGMAQAFIDIGASARQFESAVRDAYAAYTQFAIAMSKRMNND